MNQTLTHTPIDAVQEGDIFMEGMETIAVAGLPRSPIIGREHCPPGWGIQRWAEVSYSRLQANRALLRCSLWLAHFPREAIVIRRAPKLDEQHNRHGVSEYLVYARIWVRA